MKKQDTSIRMLNEMLRPDFEWEKHDKSGGSSQKSVIQSLFKDSYYSSSHAKTNNFAKIASKRPQQREQCLFKILCLFPQYINDNFYMDMYKNRICTLLSACGRFLIEVDLYKYELTYYCYVKHPSQRINAKAHLFFETFEKAINSEMMIYGPNNYRV